MSRMVFIFIATSLDGFIAREDGSIDWLSMVDSPDEDYGYEDINESADTIIMGRKTYDKLMEFADEFPHKDKKVYIISRKERAPEGNIIFTSKDPCDLVRELKLQVGKNIYIDGGAQIVQELMKQDLIDEYIISIIPVILGSGIALFGNSGMQKMLRLKYSSSFGSGLVQVAYERVRR
jgi:dihydrofolate reductase